VTLLINDDSTNNTCSCLWGVGRRFAEKQNDFGIYIGMDLRNQPEEWVRKNLGGVVVFVY
jgi:hypothetical protein